jgi:cation transport ATPase
MPPPPPPPHHTPGAPKPHSPSTPPTPLNPLHSPASSDGTYAGFDTAALTCRDGGKAAAITHLQASRGHRNVVMIGDGATDMQARPPASVFIGYGGIVTRPAVAAGADWFITDFAHLLDVVKGL